MVFFPAFLFAAYANLVIAIRGLVLKGRDGVVAQLHFVCCLVGVLGLLLGFEMVPDPTKGIAGDAYNWSPVAFLGSGRQPSRSSLRGCVSRNARIVATRSRCASVQRC